MICLSYYWFRHKYCDDKRIANQLMSFAWIFVMQWVIATLTVLATYYFITLPFNNGQSAQYGVLVYQIELNFVTFFLYVIPCWYILRTHKKCFLKNK